MHINRNHIKGRVNVAAKEKEFHFMVRNFPKTLHKRIKVKAAQQEITMKELTIKALEEYLKKVGG
jgi:predicted HicB family RNase H-like nuclease